jgi:hypothetical protein
VTGVFVANGSAETRGGVHLGVGAEQRQAFKKIKEYLVSPAVL